MMRPLDPVDELASRYEISKPKYEIYRSPGRREKCFVGQCTLNDAVTLMLRLPGAESAQSAKYTLALRALHFLSEKSDGITHAGKSYDLTPEGQFVEFRWGYQAEPYEDWELLWPESDLY